MLRALTAFSLLLTSTALAQTATVTTTDPSRGVTLLPGSGAFGDDASNLVFNPAALTRVGTLSAIYEHERSNTRRLDSDAFFAAAAFSQNLGLGVGFESLRANDGGPDRARTSLGLALGTEVVSAGASVNWLFGGATNGLVSVDVGLQARPLRWLAFSANVRNLNAPERNGVGVNREYALGLGVRPFKERLTLGVDWLAMETVAIDQSRMQYTAQWQVIHGLRVLAGVSHGFNSAVPLSVQAGLGLDLEHFGYTQGVSWASNQLNWQFVARYSADAEASIVPRHTIAVLSLGDIAGSQGSTIGSLLGVGGEDRYLKFLTFLDRAAADPTLDGVVLKIEGASIGMARADEVRRGLLKLREAGKKVYAYVLQVTDVEYLMASACDVIYAAPDAMMMVDGLRSSVQFIGGTAELLGIDVDVARVGPYKNFPDQFTRKNMSDEQREALNAYLDTTERAIAERITGARRISAEAWRAIIDEGMKPVARAKELKQIDEVLTPALFDQAIKSALPGSSVMRRYSPAHDRELRWGSRAEIAIIPVLGGISGGSDSSNPLTGEGAGAQTFIQSLNAAAEDDDVKAIVVRVDSGGGDALASDLMYRAVVEAKKRKPVISSMGDVAASGGYYVAMGADQIFASATTLTGSIGIFFVKPALKKTANAAGISQDTISRGKLAGMFDLYDPWTEEQRAAAQKWVEAGYDLFITEVAASRHLTKEQVDAVGKGRVWSGEDAKTRGLVDVIGGLQDAIAAAKSAAHVSDEDVEVRVWQSTESTLAKLAGASVPNAILEVPVKTTPLPDGLMKLAAKLGQQSWLLESPGLQARLEFDVQLQ